MLDTTMDLTQLHRAATSYYLDNLRQADIADQLGVSRPTVSKLLAEARRIGMVRFQVADPHAASARDLEDRLRRVLGLDQVRIAPGDQEQRQYRDLGVVLARMLGELGLVRGDVLLISSGRTTHEVSDTPRLPDLPGVIVAPTVGGQQETEEWFQTNETVRRFSNRTHAVPRFIFAPAQPSPQLWESLQEDPSFTEITSLWASARAALVGIGAPVLERTSLTSVLPRGDHTLERAVGDVCLHFFDRAGEPVEFPGSDLLVRPSIETLRAVPISIAIAVGPHKALSIRAGALTGMFRSLVTDVATAEAVLSPAV